MMTSLNMVERQALAALADALIPASEKGISAREAGIAGQLLQTLEAIAPERLDLLRTAIALSNGRSPEVALDELRRQDIVSYDRFCETIAALYFMAPAVREAIGYHGRQPKAARTDVAELADLLCPVRNGGFAPRPTPAN